VLLNASPDLRSQILSNPHLHPAEGVKRGSPIAAVVLTGGEIDQTAGLLSLRERSPFTLHATAATLAAVSDNPMFGALAPDVVTRHAVVPGKAFAPVPGVDAELFIVPGKVPLYLEGDDPDTASESAANVGVEISAGTARLAFIPGAAAVTPAMKQRMENADVVMFDGTVLTDDEMICAGTGSRVEIAHVQYYGWALRNRAMLMPTAAQVARAAAAVEELRRQHHADLVIDAVVPDYYARLPKPCVGGWERRLLNVTPAGKVLPCHAAETIPDLEFWSVREYSLADIWKNSPAFNAFRGTDWMTELCRSCARRDTDFGGCRCQAFALTGDARNADPVCHLAPEHENVTALTAMREDTPYAYRKM
jgi:radical SAM protein with 4Fe4S-binding SPASM domain